MKWFTSICIACAFAFAMPQFATAQPKTEHGAKAKPGHDKGAKPGHDKGAKPGHDKDAKPDHGPGHDKDMRPDHGPGHDKDMHPDHVKDMKPDHVKDMKPDHNPDHNKINHRDDKPGLKKKVEKIKKAKEEKKAEKAQKAIERKQAKDEEVKKMVDLVKGHKGSHKRIAEAKKAAEANKFSCAQVKDMLSGLKNDFERMNMAVILYADVVDQENWDTVYGAFKAPWCKRTVDQKIGR